MPEPTPSLAEPLKEIVAPVFAFAEGVVILIVGASVSFITFAITRDVLLPALSLAVAVIDAVP